MTRSADQGSIADVGSPVLITPNAVDAVRPWRWTTGVIATATAVLLVLNAHSAGDWFEELTPGPMTEPLRGPVLGWAGRTEAAGLDAPRARLHALWGRVRKARFGGEEPGERGAAQGE